jgi:hypothetical protein
MSNQAEILALIAKIDNVGVLTHIAWATKHRIDALSKSGFCVGDKVRFDAKTRGIKDGILIKKNAKTFQVLVGSVTWKVSPALLRKVA